MTGNRQYEKGFRQKVTALAGLLALAVHLASFALASLMPVTTALAAAQAEPFEIVICTIHGPVTMDARELGIDGPDKSVPDQPRNACDLAIQSVIAITVDLAPATPHVPVIYVDTRIDRPTGTRPAYAAMQPRTSPPRAPPHTA